MSMNTEGLNKWYENVYPFILLANAQTEYDQKVIAILNKICNKHNVPLKTYMDIFIEFETEIAELTNEVDYD